MSLFTVDNWRVKPEGRCRLSNNFWDNTIKAEDGDCILWKHGTQGAGYGSFPELGRRYTLAHRRAYEIHYGCSLPADIMVLHHCDNPPCVNPDHLFLGNQTDNVHDMIAKKRNQYFGAKGESHHLAKLSKKQVDEIISRYKRRVVTQLSLAKEYGVSFQHISELVRGMHWH